MLFLLAKIIYVYYIPKKHEFELKNVKYRIIDVEKRTKDKQDVSVTLEADASQVTIAPVVNGKVDMANKRVLTVNQKNYENEHSVIIRDVRTPRKRYRVAKNGTFSIAGTEGGKKIPFQLIAVDAEKEMAEIVNTENENRIVLVKHARILKNAYVKAADDQSSTEKKTKKRRGRRRLRN